MSLPSQILQKVESRKNTHLFFFPQRDISLPPPPPFSFLNPTTLTRRVSLTLEPSTCQDATRTGNLYVEGPQRFEINAGGTWQKSDGGDVNMWRARMTRVWLWGDMGHGLFWRDTRVHLVFVSDVRGARLSSWAHESRA